LTTQHNSVLIRGFTVVTTAEPSQQLRRNLNLAFTAVWFV